MHHEMAQCKLDRHTRLAACDLLAWLLQREPAKRPAACADILAHAFFTNTDDHTGLRMSALHSAAFVGDCEAVGRILDAGAGSPNAKDPLLGKVARWRDSVRFGFGVVSIGFGSARFRRELVSVRFRFRFGFGSV